MRAIDRTAMYERDGGLCGFCGQHVPINEFEADHVPPRGLGLPTRLIRVSHRLCNRRAGWAVRRARHQRRTESDYALRLPKDLKVALERLAKREDRSLNAQIVRVLREWAEQQGEHLAKE